MYIGTYLSRCYGWKADTPLNRDPHDESQLQRVCLLLLSLPPARATKESHSIIACRAQALGSLLEHKLHSGRTEASILERDPAGILMSLLLLCTEFFQGARKTQRLNPPPTLNVWLCYQPMGPRKKSRFHRSRAP